MGKALIDIPDEVHWNLKRRAIDEHISLKELAVKALREYIDRHPPMRQTLFEQSAGQEEAKEGG